MEAGRFGFVMRAWDGVRSVVMVAGRLMMGDGVLFFCLSFVIALLRKGCSDGKPAEAGSDSYMRFRTRFTPDWQTIASHQSGGKGDAGILFGRPTGCLGIRKDWVVQGAADRVR